ncbi:MAG: HypC/HybG/HupF family hydrogenase formation chaperone [Candidatus Diapherotrites archaeon]|uniref:HypC/HybG/HupF family hydrogenase formation chaperone n=1 Tax=Candidatus Iainarchaeum sp. TaxID=3101447 RepID=A0A938YWG2_9ARCH|nr:HypC/HybG/HupF family hydrogenase formation chaperone [Candidatus Diapherotrites archaeon]
MCLAIPGKVLELREKERKALIEQPGSKRIVFNAIDAKPGEYVLVQQGFIVERISEKEARQALEVLENG